LFVARVEAGAGLLYFRVRVPVKGRGNTNRPVCAWDTFNAAVALRVQQEGICWMGTPQWQGQTALRGIESTEMDFMENDILLVIIWF
jgi:hypothetical protein